MFYEPPKAGEFPGFSALARGFWNEFFGVRLFHVRKMTLYFWQDAVTFHRMGASRYIRRRASLELAFTCQMDVVLGNYSGLCRHHCLMENMPDPR